MNLSKKQVLKSRISFFLSFLQFKYFLFKNRAQFEPIKNLKQQEYIVVLTPWLLNSTSWFSIVMGLLLNKRQYKVTFLLDDLKFENPIDHFLQVKMIRSALKIARRLKLEVELLSNYEMICQISELEEEGIRKLAYANAVHKNRGEEDTQEFRQLVETNYNSLLRNFPFVKKFLSKHTEQSYYLSGGIYANSGLFEYLLRNTNQHYFTFDSGFAVLLSCYRGVAAQFTDIPQALNLMLEDKEGIQRAINYARDEFDKRKNGTNKLASQYQSYLESETFENVGILIPLNSPWDSAALNIASIFNGYNDWLLETIGIILQDSSFNITIRQHPDERYWWGRTKTDFYALIKAKYGENKRIQFVTCWDKVNSYALLDNSDAVICYSSTFGIESAMSGKAVCVCSNVYYSNLGFSFKPSKKSDISYFISNIGRVNESIKDGDNAYLTYFLGQKCNWLFTTFTPAMPDFRKWYRYDLRTIENDQVISRYVESIESNLPVSFVNYSKEAK